MSTKHLMLIIAVSILGCNVAIADNNNGNDRHDDNNGQNPGWKDKNNVELYITGSPEVNNYDPNGFKDFPADIKKFCTLNTCSPTTKFPLFNPVTDKQIGYAYVWGANYLYGAGGSLCFTEIIQYDLNYKNDKDNNGKYKKGTVYTIGDNAGTCGASTDPALVKPVGVQYGSVAVVVGGGVGTGSDPRDAQGIKHGIVGATGDFAYLKGGSYIDRVFVEFRSDNTISYYNGLFFNLVAP